MIMPDVNVLIYAHRAESPEHEAVGAWLRRVLDGPEPIALSELVLSAFLRIVTDRRAFKTPTPLDVAMRFVDAVASQPNARRVRPGARHWDIFSELVRQTGASGKLLADAYHAATALEHGCEWYTFDGDFARFPDLRWRHPLAPLRVEL